MTRAFISSRHWTFTAVGMLASPVLLWLVIRYEPAYAECIDTYGSEVATEVPQCRAPVLLSGAAYLAFLALALVSAVVGLCVGVAEGRRRRRFGHGRWIVVAVVGLCAPWALAAYALGYAIGRALPRARPTAVEQRVDMRLRAWHEALHLYGWLADGRPPPLAPTPPLFDEPVHLDSGFGFQRYYSADVTYQTTSTFAFGSPAFVAGAMLGSAIGNASARSRAANLARAQWRQLLGARVVVTPSATWCCVEGQWIQFDHAAVVEYFVDVETPAVVMTFAGTDPLRLASPYAWCHAVLFAYFRHGGRPGWERAHFLYPLNEAAPQLPTAREGNAVARTE